MDYKHGQRMQGQLVIHDPTASKALNEVEGWAFDFGQLDRVMGCCLDNLVWKAGHPLSFGHWRVRHKTDAYDGSWSSGCSVEDLRAALDEDGKGLRGFLLENHDDAGPEYWLVHHEWDGDVLHLRPEFQQQIAPGTQAYQDLLKTLPSAEFGDDKIPTAVVWAEDAEAGPLAPVDVAGAAGEGDKAPSPSPPSAPVSTLQTPPNAVRMARSSPPNLKRRRRLLKRPRGMAPAQDVPGPAEEEEEEEEEEEGDSDVDGNEEGSPKRARVEEIE